MFGRGVIGFKYTKVCTIVKDDAVLRLGIRGFF